eukprot:INCI10456.1.p1 GENE.INCI10456.1~~INCI10456.1.p1  ORF type:complete len:824 (-),score=177.59 INCI10456.1:347-2818(-)
MASTNEAEKQKPSANTGLDALFDDDLEDSDSDDESFEVDENDVEDSDDDEIDGAAGGATSGSPPPTSRTSAANAAAVSGGSQLDEIISLVRKACTGGDHVELERLLTVAATPVVRKRIDGTDAPPVPAYDIQELIHARDDWDVAPFHAAILARSLECVDLLLARGVSIADRHEGFSYLHTAIATGTIRGNEDFSEKCVARLLERGADISFEDVQGFTPLHFAAFHGQHVAVSQILAAAIDRSADAVLEEGERTMVQRLLETRSHAGQTAWAVALDRGHAPIADALVKAGARAGAGAAESSLGSASAKYVAAPKQTVLYHHDKCSWHAAVDFAAKKLDIPPENADRIKVLLDQHTGTLRSSEFEATVAWENTAPEATISDILRVHEYVYIQRLSEVTSKLKEGEHFHLDADTLLNRHSFAAARRAAGTVVAAVEAVVRQGKRNALCVVRPPGHHAGPYGQEVCDDRGGEPFGSHGFCLLNNVAIGAAYARCVLRDAVRRVAILDFDVHHGNGTEAIVRNLVPSVKTHKVSAPFLAAASTLSVPSLRPWLNEDDADNVFFASVHGYEATPGPGGGVFYPGTGKTEAPTVAEDGPAQAQGAENISCDEVGQQPAQTPRQHIYNVGMRKHCRHEWRTRWENDILAPLARFKPDLILISAGFDAHCRDKLNHGYIGLVEDDYSWLTAKIVEVANTCCNGRVVSVLEGGYRIHGGIISPFARSVAAHLRALVETSPDRQWTVDVQETLSEPQSSSSSSAAKSISAPVKRKPPSSPAAGSTPQYPGNSQQDVKRSRRARAPVNYAELEAKLKAEAAAKKKKQQEAAAAAE